MGAYVNRDRAAIKQGVERMFGLFPALRERRRQPAGTLSGGQRQLVAVARALMSNPQVLMIDKPSAGLSPKLVGTVFAKVRESPETGVTDLKVKQTAKNP